MPQYAQIVIATDTAAETADTERDYFIRNLLPGKWLIKAITWLSDIAVTANGTNHSVLTLTNATASQTIGIRSYIATDSVAGTPESLAVPTGLAAVVNDGDVLRLAKTTPGTGVAIRGKMIVEIEQAPLP